MSNSVNNEKKVRAIRETKREDFVKVINDVKSLLNDASFEDTVCEATGNGLYKYSTTRPTDMTGVKSVEIQGLKWYKIPTTDYRISLTSYLGCKLTSEAKARANAIKQLADLTTEELLALLQKKA